MTTDKGRAFVFDRLSSAPDLDALGRVWDSLADTYKADPLVQEYKDKLKAGMRNEPRSKYQT